MTFTCSATLAGAALLAGIIAAAGAAIDIGLSPKVIYREDYTGDSRADSSDVAGLLRLMMSGIDPERADYNGDGRVSVLDALDLLIGIRGGKLRLGKIGRREVYPNRWVWVFGKLLNTDSDVEEIRQIARTAESTGLNGMVLSAYLDMLDLKDAEYLRRLEEVKGIGMEYGQEIIPAIFSVGYGGAVISHNRNLAAGLPVRDVPFEVVNGEGVPVPDPDISISNGDFEDYSGETFDSFTYLDNAGENLFVERYHVKEGAASLRMNIYSPEQASYARLKRILSVKPNRCYRLRFWYKSDRMNPGSSFNVNVYGVGDRRRLTFISGGINTDNEWHELFVGFNSWDNQKAEVQFGLWNTTSSRIWIDDMRFEEVPLINILRRPGTPLSVSSAESGEVYLEGTDYEYLEDRYLTFRFDHEPPVIKIPDGSGIAEGETISVSYYHGMRSNPVVGQVSVCMSEPELYEIWRTQARLVHERLAPEKYLLNMDEIRAGGTCKACVDRGLTMGEILGQCISAQYEIIKEVNPEAEIQIWSDMLDPNHNGSNRAGEHYYLAAGLYDGSWNLIPGDMVIACWWEAMRVQSLAHFSGLGFRTLAAAYYDADDLENPRNWLESLDQTPGASGIMYTTWQEKYDLLGAFGELVSGPR
ncbi:MAG: hypothetical protein FVQ81_16320 [Candidatus Glassbacteria bacterium]|nr:hypothetical protein [Candidatus Glassbacteria bacterium]